MGITSAGKNESSKNLVFIAACLAVLLAGVVVYFPGLAGPFLLDDFGSVAALGDFGGVKDWDSFRAFVFGGVAGPTGRPVALLSFLIDANDWPAEPFPFKRTNLIIHLINGVLLGVLIRQVLVVLQYQKRSAMWIALFSAAFWLLHPFLVSTTLYVVQRMAQLSTLFIIAGLIGHLYARSLILVSATRAYLIMSFSMVFFGILAALSKENGILLPMLVGVLEVTVIASQSARAVALNRYWAVAFLVIPSAIIVGYLGRMFFYDSFFEIVPPRDFSVYERILTQPRILVDYLQNWFIPKLYTTGIFQDHFVKSTGLFSPLTTIFSIVFHVAVVTVAMAKRRAWPLFALGILFFYVSHLLESTVVNLELYFEHRNYLAVGFLFVPLVAILWEKLDRTKFYLAGLFIASILAGFTHYSASLWADYPGMLEASARKAPTSVRAQARYAVSLSNAGYHDESLQVLDRAIRDIPGEYPLLLVSRVVILCESGALNADDFAKATTALSRADYDPRLLKVYTSLVETVLQGRCPQVSVAAIRQLFTDMLLVQNNGDPSSLGFSQIKYFIGVAYAHEAERSLAVEAFEDSLSARSNASSAMQMAAAMASRNFNAEALHLSDIALSLLNAHGDTARAPVSLADIRRFQGIVRANMDDSAESGSADVDL